MTETKQGPIHWTAFCRYMSESKRYVPASIWAAARRDGLARFAERVQTGVARSELTFHDIVSRCEHAVLGGGASLSEAR